MRQLLRDTFHLHALEDHPDDDLDVASKGRSDRRIPPPRGYAEPRQRRLFGRQSAPATIAAAQEIIAANGGAALDIGKLGAGEFYFSTENSGRPAKLRTPICLTDHPANPPTPEDVVVRAKASAQRMASRTP